LLNDEEFSSVVLQYLINQALNKEL